MHISVKGEYALHAIFDLALQRTREPVKIADIAKRQKIPQKFLELILAGLKQGGFVESRRGAEGGYLLARPADAITVGEVLRFIEGTGKNRRRNQAAATTIPSPTCGAASITASRISSTAPLFPNSAATGRTGRRATFPTGRSNVLRR